jgi:outer membrane protein assembly factor BamB
LISLFLVGFVLVSKRWDDSVASASWSMENFSGVHKSISPGSINLGGPISSAGGLVSIAGTTDSRIRALDERTGKVLWEAELPAGGNATPMTYESGGKQYLVIAAGGHQGIREESLGDSLVAFSLPEALFFIRVNHAGMRARI